MITSLIYYAHWPLKVNRCILGVTDRLGFIKRDMAIKLWLFAAACFIFLGIADKNTIFIVLGATYIGIGFSMNSKKSADAAKRQVKKEPSTNSDRFLFRYIEKHLVVINNHINDLLRSLASK